MRIGKKIGNVFVSIGKSGIYSSTWIGGYRFSHFNRFKKSNKKEDAPKKEWSGEPDFEIGDWLCVLSGILVPFVVWQLWPITGWLLGSIVAWVLHIGVVMYIQHNVISDPNDTLILENKLWFYPFITPVFLITNPIGWIVSILMIIFILS